MPTTSTHAPVQPAPPAAHTPAPTTAVASMLLVILIWGVNFTATKLGFRDFPPLVFTAVRFLLASLLVAIVLQRTDGGLRLPASVGRLTALGIIGNSIYQTLFVLGLSRTTATNSSLVLASMPAMVAALGAASGTERLTRNGRRGLILASLGVLLVIAAHGVELSARTVVGDVLTLLAVVCWAVFTLGVRRLAAPLSPFAITAWTTILGTPLLVAVAVPGLVRMRWSGVSAGGWGALLYSSLLSLVVAYVLWNRSIRVVGSNRTAVFACMTPLVAMATAMLVLGERPRLVQIAGGAMILAGVLLSQRAPALRDAPSPAGDAG